MKFIKLFALLLFVSNLGFAKEYQIYLSQALITPNQRVPLIILIEENNGQITRASALSPYYAIPSISYMRPNYRSFPISISAFTVQSGVATMVCAGTVRNSNNLLPQNFTANISFSENNGVVRGEYTGTCNADKTGGQVHGNSYNTLNPSANLRADILLEYSIPPGFSTTEANHGIQISAQFNNGIATNVQANFGYYSTTLYNVPDIKPCPTYLGVNGYANKLMLDSRWTMQVLSHQLNATGDSIYGQINMRIFNRGNPIGRFIYQVNGRVLARRALGNYSVSDTTGNTIKANGPFAGNLNSLQSFQVPLPIDTIKKAPPQQGTAFQPPYYLDLGQQGWLNNLKAAGTWLYQSPEIGAFHDDYTVVNASSSGSKQYDNAPENAYGGVVSSLTLAALTNNQSETENYIASARRAGYFLQINSGNRLQIPMVYKGMFWITGYGGLAYIELYKATKDKQWLDLAVRYARSIETMQEEMFSIAKGTWTYFWPEGENIGQSNERNNRAFDNRPLHCAEFLYFLGKLRVEGGINDFVKTERRALRWMKENSVNSNIWKDRRPGSNQESGGPSLFLLYNLLYSEKFDQPLTERVLEYIASTHSVWTHTTAGFTPNFWDYMPRHNISDSPNSSVTVTSRMGWVYFLLHQKTGNPEYYERGKTLAYSALSRQNLSTGMLHHLGINNLPADDVLRIQQSDQHQMSSLKADALHNLLACYKYMLNTNEFGANSIKAAFTLSADSVELGQAIQLNGTASQGNGLTYEWHFGNGATATGAITNFTFTAAGNYNITLKVSSGNVYDVVTKQVKVFAPRQLTSIKVEKADLVFLPNTSWQYIANAYDQYGILLNPQPIFAWSASGSHIVSATGILTTQSTTGDHIPFTVSAEASGITGQTQFFVVNQLPDPGYRYLRLVGGKTETINGQIARVIWKQGSASFPPVQFTSATNGSMRLSIIGNWTSIHSIYNSSGSSEVREDRSTHTLDLGPAVTCVPDSGFMQSTVENRIPRYLYFLGSVNNTIWDTLYKQNWGGTQLSKTVPFTTDGKVGQYLEFEYIYDKIAGDLPFEPTVYTTTNLPYTINVVSGPATASNNIVSLTGQAGVVRLSAFQPGNQWYRNADTAYISFQVFAPTNALHKKEEAHLVLFPNPAREEIHIAGMESGKWNCFNALGKQYRISFRNGSASIAHLPPGVYWLKVQNKSLRFIKQ